jgi:hypothetical protein
MAERALPRPSPDVVYQELRGEVVLVHLRTNRIYALNETGARLWQLLDEGCDRAEIKHRLAEEFDVGAEDLQREMEGLLASLADEGLVD